MFTGHKPMTDKLFLIPNTNKIRRAGRALCRVTSMETALRDTTFLRIQDGEGGLNTYTRKSVKISRWRFLTATVLSHIGLYYVYGKAIKTHDVSQSVCHITFRLPLFNYVSIFTGLWNDDLGSFCRLNRLRTFWCHL
jgi:hypothetical protein